MEFLFFNAADTPLFLRSDAEQATWTVEEYTLQCLFPYHAEKPLERGQRIGFKWQGTWQLFEIRKVKTYEPDHYQEITAEHIAVSELTDEHFYQTKITNETAGDTVEVLLDDTQWELGNDTSSGTQSADIGTGSVWQDLMTVQSNWNVYIIPRVTIDSTGITGRYIDIIPAQGTWHGVRLSVDKNADEVGVTIDDTELATALYGYGVSEKQGDENVPLTFADIEWAATSEHPQKPLGQKYIEDPNATLLYGRNGRPRFAYYSNSSIDNAETLLEYTWESLQQCNKPKVTIDCNVRDLYRLGYADQPIHLHDIAFVDVQPINEKYQLEIIRLTIDLLDPTQTRPTIGAYIPNIVYINRDNAKKTGGGGGRGKSDAENERVEFETAINRNQYEIQMRATQYDLNITNQNVAQATSEISQSATRIQSLVTGTGALLDENGNLIVDGQGNPIFTTDGSGLYSKISQNAQQIALRVVKGNVATQLAVEAGNVSITGGNLVVEGYATVQALNATKADITNLTTGTTTAQTLAALTLRASSSLYVRGSEASWHAIGFSGAGLAAGQVLSDQTLNLNHYHAISASESGGVVTITQGAPQATAGEATFNIAATSFYQNAVAAAYQRGVQDGQGTITVDGVSVSKSGNPSWSGNTLYQNVFAYAYHLDGETEEVLAHITSPINVTSIYNDGANSVTLSEGWNSNATYIVSATNGASQSTTLTGLELISTQRNPSNNHWMGTFSIQADNTEVTRKTIDINSTIMGITLNNVVARSSITVYNDSSGTVYPTIYITLSNGNTYTRQVAINYTTID